MKSLSCIWPSATPWTAAYQAPPSMGFSRQEYWSGVPLPSQNNDATRKKKKKKEKHWAIHLNHTAFERKWNFLFSNKMPAQVYSYWQAFQGRQRGESFFQFYLPAPLITAQLHRLNVLFPMDKPERWSPLATMWSGEIILREGRMRLNLMLRSPGAPPVTLLCSIYTTGY